MTMTDLPRPKPLVGLSACSVELDGVPNYVCRANYARAALDAGCIPMVLPAAGPVMARTELVDVLDGLILTGSVSNVDPARYRQDRDNSKAYDEARDASIFPLIRAAIDSGVPILGICRGLHEINVALGGSLFQNVHEVEGKMDHREDVSQPRAIQYAPAHVVRLSAGGVLEAMFGCRELHVSSLHWQGIDMLGAGLTTEAVAADGLVEAVSLCSAQTWLIGVQWHPEWFASDRNGSLLFHRFAEHCSERRMNRSKLRTPSTIG
jgi:putative glutamine amidotransferase